MGAIAESVEAFRTTYRRDEIGPRYTGWGHFALTSATSLGTMVFAAAHLHEVRGAEWLVVPATFCIANLGEYLGHRGPMHHPQRGLKLLFQRHTLQHHQFFTDGSMRVVSSRDFKMVLFPPVMLVFFLGCLATPIGLGLFATVGANAAWLYVIVLMGYFLTYEWLHLAYHVVDDRLIPRIPWLAQLRRHHLVHHDPRLMGRYNFNITFPICDRVFGTMRTDPSSVATDTEREPAPGR